MNSLIKRFRSYYARILFFAFLTKKAVISLDDVIGCINSIENKRISKNLGINQSLLIQIRTHINKFILRDLDYKIQNLNSLSHDETMDSVERATIAVRKFGKLGESEVVTPSAICDEMVALIPDEGFEKVVSEDSKILDVAGKMGEFAISLYKRFLSLGYRTEQIRSKICTIPTSGLAYEFTRYVYETLGLDVACIAESFDAYLLSSLKTDDSKECTDRVHSKIFTMC